MDEQNQTYMQKIDDFIHIKNWTPEQKQERKKIGKILLAETIGTFILVAGILLPGAIGVNLGAEAHGLTPGEELGFFWNSLNIIFSLIIFKALYVALLILVLVLVLIRWSVNLNPAVTLSEMALGNDSYKLGFTKITLQFISAIAASIFMVQVVLWTSGADTFNDALTLGYNLDAVYPGFGYFNYGNIDFSTDTGWSSVYATKELTGTEFWWYWILSIGFEAVLTFALIISIFWGSKITAKQRPYVIFAVVWAILIVGLRVHAFALNPARLIGPAFIEYIVTDGESYGLTFVPFYLLGELIAVAIFVGITRKNLQQALVEHDDSKAYLILTGNHRMGRNIQGYDMNEKLLNQFKEHRVNLTTENLYLKVENEHLKLGNMAFEKMSDNELYELTKISDYEKFQILSKEEKILQVKQDLSEKYIDLELTREATLSQEIMGLDSKNLEVTKTQKIQLSEAEKNEFSDLIDENTKDEVDFSKLTIAQLKQRLDEKEIKYKAGFNKKMLIELLQEDSIKNIK